MFTPQCLIFKATLGGRNLSEIDTFISTSRTPGVFVVLDPVTLMAASLYLEIQSVQTTQIVTVGKKG